jgi:hypothetical protein
VVAHSHFRAVEAGLHLSTLGLPEADVDSDMTDDDDDGDDHDHDHDEVQPQQVGPVRSHP